MKNDAKLIFEAYQGKNHDETDMSNPSEKREVEIGKQIIHYANQVSGRSPAEQACLSQIDQLANELIKMHGSKLPADYSKMNQEEKSYVRNTGAK